LALLEACLPGCKHCIIKTARSRIVDMALSYIAPDTTLHKWRAVPSMNKGWQCLLLRMVTTATYDITDPS